MCGMLVTLTCKSNFSNLEVSTHNIIRHGHSSDVVIMPPPLGQGALSDDARLSLTSVAYIGTKSRTERPMKTKIGTEVAHVTRDSTLLSRSKGQQSTCRELGHILAASRTSCFQRHHPAHAGRRTPSSKFVARFDGMPRFGSRR